MGRWNRPRAKRREDLSRQCSRRARSQANRLYKMVGQNGRLPTRGERPSPNSVNPRHARLAIDAKQRHQHPQFPSSRFPSNVTYSRLASLLLDHASRILVLAQSHKLRMSQPISFGPFQEFDLSEGFWLQPNCLLHFLSVEFFTKS